MLDEKRMAVFAGQELQYLLEIDSVSGNEAEMLLYLEKRCRDMGLPTKQQKVVGERYNLLVNPLSFPELMITAHVDTVPPVINGTPCRHEIVGERFYGRGAADVKGGIASLLAALNEITIRSSEGTENIPPVMIAFNIDEERSGCGSEKLARLGGRYAVVIEPTEMKLCTAQCGSVVLHLQVFGRPSHGGEIEAGDNAIVKALSFLQQLNTLPIFNSRHPTAGRCGYNLQMINGGSNELAVPHKCELILDFRVLPGQHVADVQAAVEKLLNSWGGIEGSWVDISASYELDEQEHIFSFMSSCYKEALGTEPHKGSIKSWTDAENLYSVGIKPLVFGPGKLSVCHTNQEYIELSEMIEAARVFAVLMSRAGELRKVAQAR